MTDQQIRAQAKLARQIFPTSSEVSDLCASVELLLYERPKAARNEAPPKADRPSKD